MRISRKPTGARFFELFTEAGANIGRSVELLREFVRAPAEQRAELAVRMHALENAGDDATHAIIEHLDRSFVTPFDREDIYRLASDLDDVMDFMEEAVDTIHLFNLEKLPEEIAEQIEVLQRAAQLTAETMPRLRTMKDLAEYWIEINRLENTGDAVHRRLIAKLFSGEYEALTVMKLKTVVDLLEAAIDAFEHVANTVEQIAVKES